MVLGPRLKIIIMNILPESNCNELKKYPLKIAFMFLLIIMKLQVPNLSVLLVIKEKVTVLNGPWSATQVSSTKKRENVIVSTGKCNFHNISMYFFYS